MHKVWLRLLLLALVVPFLFACPTSSSPPEGATPTPTFIPASDGCVPSSVTISDFIVNATIYYTTDGTTPTTSSALYSAPLTGIGSGTVTVKAIAIVSGLNNSAVATVTYGGGC
jgi:hypothetical protein